MVRLQDFERKRSTAASTIATGMVAVQLWQATEGSYRR
ncbi:unnamed protein product [Ciceribacter sp. T2.26MG-112.2]|nr:unnamed protein product [Ciceribacter naphthalenivorans]